MNYCDIIKTSPSGGITNMWDSVKRISNFIEEMRETHPHKVKTFLKEEYIALNGRHFNEATARDTVMGMHHTGNDGKQATGEAVSVEDAQMLVDGMESPEKWKWDAYVAANTMAHDLGNTGMSMNQIMTAAKHFFFHDEDFSDGNKVFWYYEWTLF